MYGREARLLKTKPIFAQRPVMIPVKIFSRYAISLFCLLTLTVNLLAQDSSSSKNTNTDIDVTINSNDWYTQPWVWVVGGAVFILLLVALLSCNKRKDTVIIYEKTEQDNRVN